MNSKQLIEDLKARKYDDLLKSVYIDESLIDYQVDRYVRTIENFEAHFGIGDVSVFSIPGRSEVAGNHTDHQNGCVLACGVNLDILAVVRKSEFMNIYSNNRPIKGVSCRNLTADEKDRHNSSGLVKGVLAYLKDKGYQIGNFSAVMTSDVLVGSGLSSSAAFENAIGTIISGLFNDSSIDKLTIAQASQFAENVYFGKPSGLMEQCACAFGGLIFIDFNDLSNPKVREVKTDFSKYGYSLCIVNTKGSHAKLNDEYAQIPAEMKSVAACFGKKLLNEVTLQQITDNIPELRKKVSDRAILRSIHVLEENERVRQQVINLENDDFASFLKLISESGNSSYKYLQNVYSNADYENQPVSLALKLSEIYLKDKGVARVHGGGFAGTIQAFVSDDHVQYYKKKMEETFGEGSCMVLKVSQKGACEVFE